MIVNYGLICEDIAQKTFLKKFLENFKGYNFINNEIFFKRYRAKTKKEVLKAIPFIGYQAFEEFQLKLLFIGVDYDDLDRKNFKNELDKLYKEIEEKVRKTTIIFYPVQAIEHWLLYLKHHSKNPKSTKNISFEQISRNDAKKEIYNQTKRISDAKTIKVITELTKEFDINWLKSRSESFKYFYNDFLKFLETL